MKKLLFVICATALLGLTSACVDPMNNVKVDNPNYDPIKDAVTAQFIINIGPADADARTKQQGSSVQIDTTFRGVGNATLFTIVAPDGDGHYVRRVYKGGDSPQPGDTLFANSYIPLATALQAGVIGKNAEDISRRVMEISIPKGTNTLLFYGEAVTGTSDDEMNEFGALQYTMEGKNLLSIGCNARPRLLENTQDATDFYRVSNMMLSVLNHMFLCGLNFTKENGEWTEKGWENLQGDDTNEFKFKRKVAEPKALSAVDTVFGIYSLDGRQIHWKDFKDCKTSGDPSPLNRILLDDSTTEITASPMEQILALTYNAFVTFNTNELRAGSGQALVRQMRDLHSVISGALDSDPINDQERVAQAVLREIDAYLHTFFTISTQKELTAWKAIKSSTSTSGVRDLLYTLHIDTLDVPSKDIYSLNGFPFHFNLPMGAATLLQGPDEYHTFIANTDTISLHAMGGEHMSVFDYTYPPSLTYFGNSPIRVSNNNNIAKSSFPDGVAAWETLSNWPATDTHNDPLWEENSHVKADTRAVAMKYNVHYGNALLQTKVKFKESGIVLEDNNLALNGEANKTFTVGELVDGSPATLTLTGVLVGGQPDHVGWCYIPVAPMNGTLSFNRMIYDKRLNGATAVQDGTTGIYSYPITIPVDGTQTPANYTVVFDNYDPTLNDGQKSVFVALEFVNNLGKDFWGNANMVRNGGTFYLMAELKMTAAMKNAFDWSKTGSVMPPYYETDDNDGHHAGDTKQHVRVFMQRHTTVANFVINSKSLQAAFVTVPDLRSAKMSFGLSVDLGWRAGLTFEDVPLGKNE